MTRWEALVIHRTLRKFQEGAVPIQDIPLHSNQEDSICLEVLTHTPEQMDLYSPPVLKRQSLHVGDEIKQKERRRDSEGGQVKERQNSIQMFQYTVERMLGEGAR